jgi:hypothetical protein
MSASGGSKLVPRRFAAACESFSPARRGMTVSRRSFSTFGKAADLVVIDWDKVAYPYVDPETPVLDAVVQRARSDGVDLVMVAGEVVYEGAVHPCRPRRGAARAAPIIAAASWRGRNRAAPAIKGADTACPSFLCRIFRSRGAHALLPRQLTAIANVQPGSATTRPVPPRPATPVADPEHAADPSRSVIRHTTARRMRSRGPTICPSLTRTTAIRPASLAAISTASIRG